MSKSDFKRKIAVVTGAGGTLCSEMAVSLAQKGISVALMGRTREKLEKVSDTIEKEGGKSLILEADVSDEQQVKLAQQKLLHTWGGCDILINGAGGNQLKALTEYTSFNSEELTPKGGRGFFNLDLEVFQDVLRVNTMGTVIPCQVFGRAMAEKKSGCIINLASMNTYRPLSKVAAYGMAKSGIGNFTQWLAVYLAPANVRVNAIAPGFFINERSKKILLRPDGTPSERGEHILRQTPLKRFGKANELIGCMHWLIDEEASAFVTGTVIPIDGGFIAESGI